MSECPKAECIQASRIKGLEVEQERDTKDFAELKSCVKEIHLEVVGKNGDGIKSRLKVLEITLKERDRHAERFWKIFGCTMAALAVVVAIVK